MRRHVGEFWRSGGSERIHAQVSQRSQGFAVQNRAKPIYCSTRFSAEAPGPSENAITSQYSGNLTKGGHSVVRGSLM